MAFSCIVKKRLDVEVDGDDFPTVILGLDAKDDEDNTKVYELQQTEKMTEMGIAIRPYGLVVIPNKVDTTILTFEWKYKAETQNTQEKIIADMTSGVNLVADSE